LLKQAAFKKIGADAWREGHNGAFLGMRRSSAARTKKFSKKLAWTASECRAAAFAEKKIEIDRNNLLGVQKNKFFSLHCATGPDDDVLTNIPKIKARRFFAGVIDRA
jgi:hypothetical protein